MAHDADVFWGGGENLGTLERPCHARKTVFTLELTHSSRWYRCVPQV